MTDYLITVSGCDDKTRVLVVLTAQEFLTVRGIARAVTAASRVGCQPTMDIRPATAADVESIADSGDYS